MSTLSINLNTSSYDLSIFFKIYSSNFISIFICLSEKVLVKITLIKSSVGKSIPISIKLSNLDFKSFNLTFIFFMGFFELTTIYWST